MKLGRKIVELFGLTVDRQCDYEIGTGPLCAFNLDISAMLYDKTIADRQTKTNALYAAFSGKECIEYFV